MACTSDLDAGPCSSRSTSRCWSASCAIAGSTARRMACRRQCFTSCFDRRRWFANCRSTFPVSWKSPADAVCGHSVPTRLIGFGYAVYESLVKEAPQRLRAAGCWMHARRGFDEARYTTSHPVMEETLARIQLLYDIEDRAKELAAPERHALRRMESRPIVDRLFARWQEVRPELRPTSKLAEAIGYALNRPAALQRFFEDGRIELDTGHLRRSLRGPVLGRRNYLFFGSLQGGRTAATLYSVVQSARLHRLDVTAYLTDVLRRLAALVPGDAAGIRELLPDRWAKTHPDHVLMPRLEESRHSAEKRRQRRAARRLLTQA